MMREISVIFWFAFMSITLSASIDKNELNNDIELDIIKELNLIRNETESRSKVKKIKDMLKRPQIPAVTGDPVQAVSSRVPCEVFENILLH